MPDAYKNFATSTVSIAPSPANSGTELSVQSGDGVNFPTPPFNAVVTDQHATLPTSDNSEIVRVTAISTDTLTITREQESTSARLIQAGDRIYAGVTLKTLEDIQAEIDTKSDSGHTHPISDVTNLQTSLDGKSDSGHTHDGRYYTETETDTLLDTKSDAGHTHDSRYYTEAEVDGLIEAVELGQVDWGDIQGTLSGQSDLQTALNAKENVADKGLANGYASLDAAGKVPSAQLPAIAVTDVYSAASELEQLALTAEEGDVVVRSDEGITYIHNGGSAGDMTDWTELASPVVWGGITGTLSDQADLQAELDSLKTYDIVVDASGDGDYTTLGAAITAATAGQTIFIKSGTYAESAITTTLANLTIIGENNNTTILAFSSTDGITSSGGGLTLANLSITLVNGKLDISGNSNKIVDCEFSHSGTVTDYVIQVAGTNGIFSRNRYTDGSADTVSARLQWHSSNGLITNNVFKIRSTTTDGGIYIPDTLGDNTTFSGNVIERIFDTSTAGYLVRVAAKDCTISANNFSTSSDRTQSTLLRVQGQYNVVTGNNFSHGNYAISSTCQNGTTITGNHIQGCTYGIEVVHNYHTVTGNTIRGRGAGSSWGIKADGVSYGSIVGNRIHSFTTSIELASGTTNFVVVGNEVSTVSTNAILNNGLRNTVFNNLGENETAATVHKRMKNVSGGTLTVGSVVVLNSVANSDEVTTTTTAGSNKVYGVVAETSLANATYGLIQTKGKTVSLKVNGTTDIAIGDYLSTFTTAGIAKKASAGDTVFAVALEAYATDDSSGVIDALLIEPRIVEAAGTWGSITGTLADQTDLQTALDNKQYQTVVTVGSSNADYITDGTDDDVQIQAAIDAVEAAGGGTVFIKRGTYVLGDGIVIDSDNVRLVGEGMGATILQAKTAFPTANDPIIQLDANSISLENLTLDGNNANQTTEDHYGIYSGWNSSSFSNILVRRVEVKNMNYDPSTNGVAIFIDTRAVIDSCIAHDNEGVGFYISNECFVTNCRAYDNTDIGFYVDGFNALLSNCRAEGNGNSGFLFDSTNIRGTNLSSDSNTGSGFELYGLFNVLENSLAYLNTADGIDIYGQGAIVKGNTVSTNGNDGIVASGNNAVISGNLVTTDTNGVSADNTYSAIAIEASTQYNIITDNSIYKRGGTNDFAYGIREEATTANNNIIKNNYVSGAQTAQISVQGVDTITDDHLQINSSPNTDHQVSGQVAYFTAGEALVYGDICYINSSGNMVKADADAIATGYGVAMALGTIASTATGNFLMSGFARDDTWAWTVGGPIYLSTTAGAMTQTAPSGTDDVVQVLGIATHADRMWFNPQLNVVENL